MKNNCKNRKLKFIRTKNWLKKGLFSFYVTGKCTRFVLDDFKDKSFENSLIRDSLKSLLYNYNLVFGKFKSKVDFGETNDDFILNLKSFKVEIRRTF